MCSDSLSATLAIRLGTNTKGASLSKSGSVLVAAGKAKGTISAFMFSSVISLASARCLGSLARETLNSFSHLKVGFVKALDTAIAC